jgi:hypothetical protein
MNPYQSPVATPDYSRSKNNAMSLEEKLFNAVIGGVILGTVGYWMCLDINTMAITAFICWIVKG